MNQVMLMGRLTRDPVLNYNSNTGNAMCRFTVAVDRRLSREKKQEMEANNQPTADFIGCICWGRLAENVNTYTAKGNRVIVEGRIQTGSYTAKDGTRRYTTDVVCNNVEFIDWKNQSSDASGNRSNYDNYSSNAANNAAYPQNQAAQSAQDKTEQNNSSDDEDFFGDDFSPVDDERIPF